MSGFMSHKGWHLSKQVWNLGFVGIPERLPSLEASVQRQPITYWISWFPPSALRSGNCGWAETRCFGDRPVPTRVFRLPTPCLEHSFGEGQSALIDIFSICHSGLLSLPANDLLVAFLLQLDIIAISRSSLIIVGPRSFVSQASQKPNRMRETTYPHPIMKHVSKGNVCITMTKSRFYGVMVST
ncbi:hypothetical protein MCOR17_004679 [Pyricularia oryzae]|nr:hypothetical protein MCOR17_004679 [Pyricularia oryzae]KAI6575156.1 hypothetical protein MCOR09_001832 [Pyricularia oryzae]KAI6584361.1 hypothetical protein MCOR06_007631 [Pyricularia oryzae]